MQEFKYQLKILIRNRTTFFWSIIFPLILATLFNFAFSGLSKGSSFNIIDIAVVEVQESTDFKVLLDSLSEDNENQLFNIQYVSKSEAEELLKADKIVGYLTIDEEIIITVNEKGISQTIIQSVVSTYSQISSTMANIYELNPNAFVTGVFDDLGIDRDNFNEVGNKNVDIIVIYFYTLIGMNCMLGSFRGLEVTNNIEANLSRQGTRISMSPTPKIKVLLTGLIAGFLCQMFSMLLLLGYLIFGLGISFGSQTGFIILLMMVGSFTGISMGTLVGNALKTNADNKMNICAIISQVFSFLAGMMIIDIKCWIQEFFPIGAYINPVNLITDALYSLYYYTTTERYFFNVFCLLIIGIIMSAISLILMRNKKYDSI